MALFRKKQGRGSSPDGSGSPSRMPSHIAFIMDGNGRWARKRGMPREYGHAVGADNMKTIVRYCGNIGIDYVSLYVFSTENWKRPKQEVDAIMDLFSDYLDEAKRDLDKNDARYVFMGDKSAFSDSLREKMNELEKLSEHGKVTVNFAINYGGRDDIIHACREMLKDGCTDFTEEELSARLYTKGCPDPDIIVRTGGEKRLSNFLLWQSSYSELYFTDTLWPDLKPAEIDRILDDFMKRDRRFGGLKNDSPN